jgi:hypothetical protein
LFALPLAIGVAWAAGIVVPLAGWKDMTGFVVSLFAAVLGSAAGSAAGIALWRRIEASRPVKNQPALGHAIGARRPAGEPVVSAAQDE